MPSPWPDYEEDPIGYGSCSVNIGRAMVRMEAEGGAISLRLYDGSGHLMAAPVKLLIWGDAYTRSIDMRGEAPVVIG